MNSLSCCPNGHYFLFTLFSAKYKMFFCVWEGGQRKESLGTVIQKYAD